MNKQLIQLAALALALVPAIQAGIVVNDPVDYTTAKVDPSGAQDVDGMVGPNLNLSMWNAQSPIYTIDFDQTADFTNGQQLDTVNLTALGQGIAFSAGNTVTNTAIRCTSGTQSITNPGASTLTIAFDKPVTGVAFTGMYEGGGLRAAYYGAGHSLLYYADQNANGGDTTTNATWMDYFFTYQGQINGAGTIVSIEITRLYVTDSFSIDDLSFTVPEPASLGLLALGTLALARRRRG